MYNLLTIALLIGHIRGLTSHCFSCHTTGLNMNPAMMFQLRTQSDVFFFPPDQTATIACNSSINDNGWSPIEGHICDKSMCVTLMPNLPEYSLVIRGCKDQVLRSALANHTKMHQEGCYLVRGGKSYPNVKPIDYIICLCEGKYCNRQAPPHYVPGNYSFARDNVIQLTPTDPQDIHLPGTRVQLAAMSSSAMSIYSMLMAVVATIGLL